MKETILPIAYILPQVQGCGVQCYAYVYHLSVKHITGNLQQISKFTFLLESLFRIVWSLKCSLSIVQCSNLHSKNEGKKAIIENKSKFAVIFPRLWQCALMCCFFHIDQREYN